MLNMLNQAMLEDKLRATDWEATNEAIEEQVARDSYLQWLRDTEKRDKALARVNNYIHANYLSYTLLKHTNIIKTEIFHFLSYPYYLQRKYCDSENNQI